MANILTNAINICFGSTAQCIAPAVCLIIESKAVTSNQHVG
jgi:hypothetical protein